ncbi:PSP1 C-terminal conserved region-domain-containing protein [Hygrophoropsis aurantiaca]|uniref:PSP1 C-terminal conserved region-domain-containing protein n=1 Tax=Hygrophoropsis aurantiaca TaxID=72124 RepID=A0ACB8A639_9AGAM|nr:PSP1 C-terminal conserved region-domain-containing protein [Hygrophoropsis aurantiaca]
MMQYSNSAHPSFDDEADRRNRFLTPAKPDSGSGTHRERATSQPPHSNGQSFQSSPSQQHIIPSSLAGNSGSLWSSARMQSSFNPTARPGPLPSSVPTRSSSFSNPQSNFSSAMRDARAFPSTIEDDESEALSDTYDDPYISPSMMSRGRTYAQDLTRSRSQSLATTTRPGPIGSPFQNQGLWSEASSLSSNPLNIPGSRYGEIKPPGSSRYGSLGTMGRSPLSNNHDSPIGGANGYSNRQTIDISNMSPFVRDVGQILLDDGSAFRELWAGMNPPKDENGGGGSGTTSRRHSVSVVQPRRPTIVGFNAPGNDLQDEPSRPGIFQTQSFGRGGLMISDDDLAADLGVLSLSGKDNGHSSSAHPPSQPSSLPIYAPLSRSPPSSDRVSPYQPLNLSIPGGSFSSRQPFGSPSDSGLSTGGSPPRSAFEQQLSESQYIGGGAGQQLPLTARFIPGQGIQYLPQQGNGSASFQRTGSTGSGALPTSPISPTTGRAIQPQQGPFYPQQIQRRPSDAAAPTFSDLGKGVPLSSVPASCPLYIVEFKAGRTDLFYLTDLSLDVRVGDLVIVEADRGKDLGKVVNDSITLKEVEAFQREQKERIGFGDGGPMSPGGPQSAPSAKKEINPKMIYGKAQPQDTQHLIAKMQDEVKALQLCQSKVRQKKLPMEVIDAEYQWDRRKLTFYFVAEKRIDFRELVRELFRLYKTRIWMASLQGSGGYEQ